MTSFRPNEQRILLVENLWQDIATAPKDGTTILGYTATAGTEPHFYHPIYFYGGHWHEQGIDGAVNDGWYTHWQPLPSPPKDNYP